MTRVESRIKKIRVDGTEAYFKLSQLVYDKLGLISIPPLILGTNTSIAGIGVPWCGKNTTEVPDFLDRQIHFLPCRSNLQEQLLDYVDWQIQGLARSLL